MTIRVKICGIIHPDDADLAIDAGADLVGLNFRLQDNETEPLDLHNGIFVSGIDRAVLKGTEPEFAKGGEKLANVLENHVSLARELGLEPGHPALPFGSSLSQAGAGASAGLMQPGQARSEQAMSMAGSSAKTLRKHHDAVCKLAQRFFDSEFPGGKLCFFFDQI